MDPRPSRRADRSLHDGALRVLASQWILGRVVALTVPSEVVMGQRFERPYWRTGAFLLGIAVKKGGVRRRASFVDEYRGRRDRRVELQKNTP